MIKDKTSFSLKEALNGKKFLILSALAFLGAVYFLASLGPKPANEWDSQASLNQEESPEEILQKSQDLLASFDKNEQEGTLNPYDWNNLIKAISLKEVYQRTLDTPDSSLEADITHLKIRYQDHFAEPIRKESLLLQEEAQRLLENSKRMKGISALEHARDLEESLGAQYPKSSLKDLIGILNLSRKINTLKAENLYNKSKEVEVKLSEAIASGVNEEIRLFYVEAIAINQKLVTDFASTAYSDVSRLKELEQGFASFESLAYKKKVDHWIQKASSANEKNEHAYAAKCYTEAIVWQEKLNDSYPSSRYYSLELAQELESCQERASFAARMKSITTLESRIKNALIAHDYSQAKELIPQFNERVSSLGEKSLNSNYFDEELRTKSRYLMRVSKVLDRLHNEINEQLLPLGEATRMYATQVPQSLYRKVMGKNPSRHQGQDFPVESLTWDEAKDFCRKLSWTLGLKVRLPYKEEFFKALGPLNQDPLSQYAWHSPNSEGEIQSIATLSANSLGFYDLLGNVNEWLETSKEGNLAEIAGGSYESLAEELLSGAVQSNLKHQRSRTIGFRFVVEG